jgi:hypothetical protein
MLVLIAGSASINICEEEKVTTCLYPFETATFPEQ